MVLTFPWLSAKVNRVKEPAEPASLSSFFRIEILQKGLNNMEINMTTIIHDDDPRIREHSADVALPLSDENRELLSAMHQYVVNSQNPELAQANNLQPAVGIAAIQLGIPLKMIAVYTGDEEGDISYALVNPRVTMKSRKMAALSGGEGCLSVPEGHSGLVYRPNKIRVKGYDLLTDQDVVIEAEGYPAIVLQHEIDHLTGQLYYDHINAMDPMKEIDNGIIIE